MGTSAVTSAQSSTIRACLIQTIDTSQWAPPSPDAAGITYLPNGHLLISDSEVDEMLPYFTGGNLYEALTSGPLKATASTIAFSHEPTGVSINPTNGHLFFSDNDQKKVFEVNLGPDGLYGTKDDLVTSFSTTAFNDNDPEGVAFGQGNLFVEDGAGTEIYQIAPGANGRFDGVPPAGDDVVVTHFDTAILGVTEPEGVAFNSNTGTLYIVDTKRHLVETTTTGTLLQNIDITSLNACMPADVVLAPSSLNPAVKHLYMVDRGVDNNEDPLENDGKVYELSLDPAECAQLPENLLPNPDFEIDCNSDTLPDQWTDNSHFTRSNAVVHGGKYTGKHFATDDSSYTIDQTVNSLSAGTTYRFSGWVNIPPTTDAFTLRLEVQWRNASNNTLSTQTFKTYTAATLNGWDPVVVSLLAPAGTTNAKVRMVVSSLNATIYVDDFVFTPWTTFNFSLTNGGPKSVTQGSAVSNTIRATLVSGTTQSVSFSASGLPAGATAAFSPTACSPTCSTTFTVSTTTSTPPGTYTITVLATKGGISKATSFSLTVTAPGSTITTTSFQDGVFPTSMYFGTRDTRLSRTTPAQNFGAESTLWIDGDSGSPALLRWKGMAIPAGSTVKAATITLNVTNPTSGTYNLYALKRDWWEDQSNWNSYGPGYNWEIPGAQGTSDRGTMVVGTITAPSLGKHTIILNAAGIALVQSWVNSPSTNNGIIINKPTVTDEMAFDSRNASTVSNRPKLMVTYVAP